MDDDGSSRLSISIAAPGWRAALTRPKVLCRAAVAATLARAAAPRLRRGEVSLLLADDAAVRALNAAWRGQDRPTNVLSFPGLEVQAGALTGALPAGPLLLGDVALALETVRREALEQGKPLADHTTHLIVHGVLHLLGYDHGEPAEALVMEDLERAILAGLGIGDPYADAAAAGPELLEEVR
jgi:probable rRNA maturation factor